MITIKQRGNFIKTEKFLRANLNPNFRSILEKYAKDGVNALASATPLNTGNTAKSWGYEIKELKNSIKVIWYNSNVVDGVPIALLIQYGHGTRNGGYVQGIDYINPALQPVFDKMASEAWKEVVK